MLENLSKNNGYTYTRLTEEEMKKRGILGRLVGNVADFINPTRNGRKYSEQLWEKVFDNPIMQEKFKNKVMYGELGHPADRTEIDMEKVAVCMAEPPKKDKDGTLKAVFDILPTPNGRILKALCDYGSTLGISSRGTGDVITDDDGNEMVDPDTYDCECWDIVLVPAVESARLQYVNESVAKGNTDAGLKKALCESLNNATEDERKVMEETLHNLDIDLNESTNLNESITLTGDGNTTFTLACDTPITTAAINDGTQELVKSLQETLKSKASLEEQVKELQEKLAVSDTKASELQEELSRYKQTTIKLSSAVSERNALSQKVSALEEELKTKTQTIERQTSRISSLVSERKESVAKSTSLNESLSNKDAEVSKLNESLENQRKDYEAKISELNESISAIKSSSEAKVKELNEQLSKSEKIREGWKKKATETVNRYIESKALLLGVESGDIKAKLPSSYTLDDVDSVCESLQSYALNISKLPFSFDRKVKVKVRESKNDSLVSHNDDDEIDNSLKNIAGLQ